MLFTSGLSSFFLQKFPNVTDPLVLVWVRLSQRADICRDLPDLLPIDAGDHQTCLLVDGDIDPRGNRIFDGMRISEREYHSAFPLLCTVPDADNFELFCESFRHTPNSVRNQSSREPVKCSFGSAVAGPYCNQLLILLFPFNPGRNGTADSPLWSCDDDLIGLNVDFHLIRYRNRLSTYS